ncbi:serine/threonine-protein kinase-like protein At5g23170 [Fagus crenata]
MEEYDYEELVTATESFSQKRLIGKGSHGLVYKGVLKDKKLVAIKKPITNTSEVVHDNSKLDNEIRVLLSLRENPHVINLLGTSQDSSNNKLLVMELMPQGSLHDLLHGCTTPPTWPKRVEIAIQVAKAVQFLHEGKPLVIHRDIKNPASIVDWAIPLIGEQRIVEICDTRIALPTYYMEATIRHMLCIAARCVSSNEDVRPSIGEIIRVIEIRVVQRIRFPIWMSFLRSVILLRRRQKLARRWQARCATHQQGDVHAHISSSGKLLLKEVLADITPN